MSASSLGAVIDALVAKFTGALSVPVYDGPQPVASSARQFVQVGASQELGNDGVEAESSLSLSELDFGTGAFRDEQGSVTCSVWVWGGSSWSKDMRDAAQALLDECEAAVRADPQLGGVLYGEPYRAEVGSAHMRQEQTANGYLVRIVFAVTYTNLLTS